MTGKKERGFIISFDGMVALSLAFILFIAAATYLAGVQSNARGSVFLKEFSMDAATVLEKSGLLEETVERNSSAGLRSFLNKMPAAVCMEVKIFDNSDLVNAEVVVLKAGCTAEYFEKTSLKRGFVAGDDPEFYIAEVSAWKKVG